MSKMSEKLVTIGEYHNDMDAHLARIALETEGIEACVMGDFLAGTSRFGTPKEQLRVLYSDTEKAKKILAENTEEECDEG